MTMTVWCTFDFEAWHRWPEAPDEFAYLRDRHRHIFKCKAEWSVDHGNRQLEFIHQKSVALAAVAKFLQNDQLETWRWSCEHWAAALLDELEADCVTVSEDGENGATIERGRH